MEYITINTKKTGKKINDVRKAKQITVSEIAKFMDFSSERAVYNWFNGNAVPTVDNLCNLAHFLGVTMDELIITDDEIG